MSVSSELESRLPFALRQFYEVPHGSWTTLSYFQRMVELKDPFSMLVIVRSSNLKSGHEEKRAKGTMMYLLSTVVSILVTMIPSDTDVVTLHYDTLLHIQKKSKLTYWRIIL